MQTCFLPGIDVLGGAGKKWLRGRRIGLVSHPAAVSRSGAPSFQILQDAGARLSALFGPEHGFFGTETAGRPVRNRIHPRLGLPVYSLYGAHRRPTPAMLENIDAIVFDLQDLGARPYTFVSTLRYLLEAAARERKEVIVADRPIPLPRVVDGPMLDGNFSSFVACVPAPMHYGMTPGETSLWIKKTLNLDLNLKVAQMRGYSRQSSRGENWPPWIPPSPGMRSWETGQSYLATIFGEALPAINIGRDSNLVFQVFSNPKVKSHVLCKYLNRSRLPGVAFFPHPYKTAGSDIIHDGVRLAVSDPVKFRPVATSVTIIALMQELCGPAKIWRKAGTREDFFDKLYGTDRVRLALQADKPAEAVIRDWQGAISAFMPVRKSFLLYGTTPG
jgi:uncharacterized protein YbbC (DUF1343 family)